LKVAEPFPAQVSFTVVTDKVNPKLTMGNKRSTKKYM
jgi:hypothetical protein